LKEHPDKGGDPSKFKEISAAFEILGNKEKKEKYDRFGLTDDKQQHMNIDPMDIFNQMFGQYSSPFENEPFSMFTNCYKKHKKQTQQLNFNISLNDMYNGKEVKMKLDRNGPCDECEGKGSKEPPKVCVQCNGSGILTKIMQLGPGLIQKMQGQCNKCNGEGKIIINKCMKCKGNCVKRESIFISVYVNPGANHDDKITLENKGDYDVNINQYSDLQIILKQKEHGLIKRKGNDFEIHYNVSLYDSLFGIHIGYKHLDNKDYVFKLKNNEVLQYKNTYIAKNMGMKYGNKHGDMYIKFDIIFPQLVKQVNKDKIFTMTDIQNMFGNNNQKTNIGTHIILEKYQENIQRNERSNEKVLPECVQQ